ncbi:RNA-binding KH domain-containing protein [Actinidia rufa]|uniref:RNA-binding KH domain-containing protein n=1 Tax=Actinidia rufa TaxID=165716 RepID=A0A7J0GYT5_9ERIC|nr:RNA-binding KH domain-containing protein [Actinidia rufa]
MEANRRSFFKKRPGPQLKQKGGNKKGKWHNYSHEQSFGDSYSSDTVYRILCHSKKIGSVIGKGGSIVKALREETQSKITVADSVAGSDERVIIIYSPSSKIHENHKSNEDQGAATETEDDPMEPHCAAQDALLKVHDRIVEEDLVGGKEDEYDENVVTARLLVPNNTVGCLLGRKGDVIQRLRSDTGANIRVLPSDHLPTCAMSTDELVQISGKPAVAKRALYEVSTLLHQNPRKDKPPLSFPMPYGGQGFHPPGPPMANMHPPGNPIWSQRHVNLCDMPPPWMGEYGNQPSGFGPGGFDGGPPMHGDEAPSEFSMKILCSAGKIGGVIGKGGFNVKQLQQETGASIHVGDASAEFEERVIRVSSFEVLWNPRSQTIDAILQLQNKTSELSEKGIITTRLLVPSSKVGCLLGQGGNVINEMRRRTQADIRVYSKEDKPKCAAEDEELVQISGNFGVAKDALAEIASRLRARCLRDASGGAEPAPVRPVKGFGHAGSLPGRGSYPSGPIRAGSSSGYEPLKVAGLSGTLSRWLYEWDNKEETREQNRDNLRQMQLLNQVPHNCSQTEAFDTCEGSFPKLVGPDLACALNYRFWPMVHVLGYENRGGGREFELSSYPVPPSATGYPNNHSYMDLKMPNDAVGSLVGTGGRNTSEIAGTRLKLQDPRSGGPECVVEIRGSSEHLNATQNTLQSYGGSAGQTVTPPQGSYHYNSHQSTYPTTNTPQNHYQNISNPQMPYQSMNAQQAAPFQSSNTQAPYQNFGSQGSYQY